MKKKALTIDEVKQEIEELKKSPYVKIAKRAENRALRQKLYTLRYLDKKGRAIVESLNIEVK